MRETGTRRSVTYVANEGFLVEAAGKKVLIDALFDAGFDRYLAPTPELLEQLAGARGPFAGVDLPDGADLGTRPRPTNLALVVDLEGARFLHLGEATLARFLRQGTCS